MKLKAISVLSKTTPIKANTHLCIEEARDDTVRFL